MYDDFGVLNKTNIDFSQEIPTYKRASDEVDSNFSGNRPGNKNPENALDGSKSEILSNGGENKISKRILYKELPLLLL